MLSWPEVVVIGAVALVFFGPKRLPEMARSLGQGIREFRKATQESLQAISENGSASESKGTCPACRGALIEESAKFCPHCGKSLSPSTS